MITLIVMGIYTLGIIYTIHHYEEAIKQHKGSISDYKRALNISKGRDHDAYLQLERQKLLSDMSSLDEQNKVLQNQIEMLKTKLAGDDSKIQYESHIYKSNTWNPSSYEISIEL